MDDSRTDAIRMLAEPVLAEQRTELVEMTSRPFAGGLLIRLLVDTVGGVTISECARLNQLVGQAIEASGVMGEDSYTLEVSSPGLDRPLRSKRDYERAVGEELTLVIRDHRGGLQETHGVLLAVQPEAIVLKTPSGNKLIFPVSQIQTATKLIRF